MKSERRTMKSDQAEYADLNLIVESFSRCRGQNGGLSTDHYLCAANQLVRMFHQMSNGLGVVLRDVTKSIKALEIRRVSGANCHYTNLELLLAHEKELKLSRVKGKVQSGTRSILKVHQAMTFMLAFLHELQGALVQNRPFKGSDRARIYQNTLGRHHPAFFQAVAKVMLLKSPGRQKIMKHLQSSCHGDKDLRDIIHAIVIAGEPVLDQASKILTQQQLPI